MDAFTQVNVYFNHGKFFFKRMFISVDKNATVEI